MAIERYAIVDRSGCVVDFVDAVEAPAPINGNTAVRWQIMGSIEDIRANEFMYESGVFKIVPQSVSMFQAREVLRRHNLLETVEAYVSTAGDKTLSLAWEYASEVHRRGEFVTALAANFSLNRSVLNKLFLEASTITA